MEDLLNSKRALKVQHNNNNNNNSDNVIMWIDDIKIENRISVQIISNSSSYMQSNNEATHNNFGNNRLKTETKRTSTWHEKRKLCIKR